MQPQPEPDAALPPLEFMHRPESLSICRSLFLCCYGLEAPVLSPDDIVHWKAQMDLLKPRLSGKAVGIGRTPTWVFGGFFFNLTTPPPTAREIDEALAESARRGVTQLLVPMVRDAEDTRALREAGFVPLPCTVESSFEVEEGVEADLRRRLGPHRFAEIRRLVRKCEERYALRFFSGEQLARDPERVLEIARLHALNILQNDLPANPFSVPVLREILALPWRDRLVVGLQVDRSNGQAVQAMILLVNLAAGELYLLAQGIDHERVDRSVNLYLSAYIGPYHYGEERGLRLFRLGRGGHDEKKKVGANRFHLLNHWIRSAAPSFHSEIELLRDLTFQSLEWEGPVVSNPWKPAGAGSGT